MLQKLLLKELTGDLTGNKIADKITSVDKTKSKEKEDETNNREETYIPPEKRDDKYQMTSYCFRYNIKMEYQETINLLDTKSDNNLRFISRKQVEGHDQYNKTYNTNQQIRFKTSVQQSDLCDCSDAYIIDKGPITAK